MNIVYAAWFRCHTIHSEDNDTLAGMYTDLNEALTVARATKVHKDDEWSIRKHLLNQIHPGETIWDDRADEAGKKEYQSFYSMHWPNGFPNRPQMA